MVSIKVGDCDCSVYYNPCGKVFRVEKKGGEVEIYYVKDDIIYYEDENYNLHRASDEIQELYREFRKFYDFVERIPSIKDLHGKTVKIQKPVFYIRKHNYRTHYLSVEPKAKVISLPVFSDDIGARLYFKIVFPKSGKYEIIEERWGRVYYRVTVIVEERRC